MALAFRVPEAPTPDLAMREAAAEHNRPPALARSIILISLAAEQDEGPPKSSALHSLGRIPVTSMFYKDLIK
jgi:hypothetical protein